MSAALKFVTVPHQFDSRELMPDGKEVLHGEPLAVAVAKFRELADRLESGELHGARVQWRDGQDVMEVVTMDGERVQLTQYQILG